VLERPKGDYLLLSGLNVADDWFHLENLFDLGLDLHEEG
jgi:hypothetical protein